MFVGLICACEWWLHIIKRPNEADSMGKDREKIIHASCDVDDKKVMLEIVLQYLKESSVSNFKSNIINQDIHVITGMLQRTREVRGYIGNWDTYQMMS